MVLASVGARLSDVFGADNILWVEGATEELCYPVIVRRVLKRPMMGTRIVGVLQTGDFDIGDPTRTIEIYRRLSHGGSLLPPAVGFMFDREGRSPDQRADIQRRVQKVGGKVEFTPRRMYENYLLHPAALAAVMNSLDGFRDPPISEQEVAEWLEHARTNSSYLSRGISSDQVQGAGWLDHVDGATVLADLFSQFSEQRYTYEKKPYGLALTEWLADNAPDCLKDIADLIDSMLSRS